jgi:aspartokinase/homoserine dehydrogenase 1
MLQKWKVHKFGGTSVLNADRYQSVAKIIAENVPQSKKAIVVSAMKGVTDDLIKAVDHAKLNQEEYKSVLKQLHTRHQTEITNLLKPPEREALLKILEHDFNELGEILRGVWLVKNASEKIYALVSGMGEVWSAQILNAHFQQLGHKTSWLDARQVLVVEHKDKRVVVDWEKSKIRLQDWLTNNPYDLITITGFVAITASGLITTLGRNGSDYSGSIFGALLDCDEVFIWTDVDGVLSADPRLVPEAMILEEMSYNEVSELAYFGAKVVHPSTMAPAIIKQIPIWIKNTFNPKAPGTKIHKNAKSDRAVKGFSTIDKMGLLNVEGMGMAGVPGVAERLFGSLRSAGVSVVLISQASSEQSICFSIPEEQCELAKNAIEQVFYAEIQKGLIQNISITKDVSILAAVGDNMAKSPGIAGRFFTALGRSGVNVRAIAQGSSERNISAVIDSRDAIKALRTVHSSFILPHQIISVGLIGPGLIGSTFLKQLNDQLSTLKSNRDLDIKVRAIADSKKMLLSEKEIPLDQWKNIFGEKSEPLDLKRFSEHIRPAHIPHAAIIEATASSALAPQYPQWLHSGLHIISPNKKANTGTMAEYLAIREAAKKSNRHFFYSTNVGAGLPILQTLRDLAATGDEIVKIQGVLSGTLSFIFNQYDGTKPFSEIVKMAKDQGFTEPDPREDLSGQDVMRKLVILAREIGMKLELTDVEVETLVPANLQSGSVEDFFKKLSELDAPMEKKRAEAQAEKQILRFVATLTADGKARVGLESLPVSHAFSRITGTDNIVAFQTQRYFKQPLVIQGPGAGPEVTAAGVFADLLRLSQYLGALP